MKIPPYWAQERYEGTDSKGQSQAFVASGWSFTSLAEAKTAAQARAQRIFDLLTHGKKPERYEYHDRPVREEILQPIGDDDPPTALITRNRYGALVLNTANVLFADVDLRPMTPPGLFEGIAMIFSAAKRESKRQAILAETEDDIARWAADNPNRSFRLYRTSDGFRLLFTDKLYDPTSEETATTFRELHTDPLYVMLTQKQECFRARITAKPWRCGSPRPPASFPFKDADAESAYRQWEAAYTKRDSGHRVCELKREFGQIADIAALQGIVKAHDLGTRIDSDAPLA